MWWMTFKNWLKKFFGKEPEQSDDELQRNNLDAQRYLDISHENITAIISNSLSILTFGDATLEITPNNVAIKHIITNPNVTGALNVIFSFLCKLSPPFKNGKTFQFFPLVH